MGERDIATAGVGGGMNPWWFTRRSLDFLLHLRYNHVNAVYTAKHTRPVIDVGLPFQRSTQIILICAIPSPEDQITSPNRNNLIDKHHHKDHSSVST